MHWTGKYSKGSPCWNNHILDGTGLDDGSLSQWLQSIGFPREMLNNGGPENRLDKVITDEFRDKLLLGIREPKADNSAQDINENTARRPTGMNYPGLIHTIHRDSFNNDANVFPQNGTTSGNTDQDINQHKRGALFKLYILSCAYFTGLQKKATSHSTTSTTSTTSRTPKTIREILYWLSALPYSQAYKEMLTHAKEKLTEVLKKPEDAPSSTGNEQKELKFYHDKRPAPITVHEYNLFAHFQAVTQYCPLVLIGIQGGIHSTDKTKEPAIHSLYANTECYFTYPTVSIQAYNQVVHYIRALFYQLYFLRKQCAVKVTYGGKWRECRYGKDVLGKGVISWMCLGCNPMEHDRKSRVGNVETEILKGIKTGSLADKLKDLLLKIGEVVVQLGNAQEALERKAESKVIEGVKTALTKTKEELDKVKDLDGLNEDLEENELKEAKEKLGELKKNGGNSGILGELAGDRGLGKATSKGEYDPGKNKISEAINGVREVLKLLRKWAVKEEENTKEGAKEVVNEVMGVAIDENYIEKVLQQGVSHEYTTLLQAIDKLLSICNSPKCPGCTKHNDKCGQKGNPIMCTKCGNMTTTGVPSPLQAFLEDRLPGFSCEVVRNTDTEKDTVYPPAASHLGHCGGSGQCCPLPMGFRKQFQKGITHTGQRLYGILYFFSNENMMQSCVYTLVRVTAELSATTPQVLGDVFGFFRGGVGNPLNGNTPKGNRDENCKHEGDSSTNKDNYFCGWCASGLRDLVKEIEWITKKNSDKGGYYIDKVGKALIDIKGDKAGVTAGYSAATTTTSNLSRLTENCQYLSPLTGELYTAVSATFGGTYLSWVLYLSDALEGGLQSLASEFQNIECRGCKGQCDPNKCKKGEHGQKSGLCGCQSIVSCTGVLPVLYRHGFSYGNPFNLEGYRQKDEKSGDYSIEKTKNGEKHCHEFLDSLKKVIESTEKNASQNHPLTELLKQVGQLQYDIRLPWIFVLTVAWLVAVLYLAFGAIWPLDWTHMRSHWLRGGEHQWQCMWYKVMTGRKGVALMEYFGRQSVQ